MQKHKNRKLVKCHRCGNEWTTKSNKEYVTCPNCTRKTPNKPVIKIPRTLQAERIEKALQPKK